VYWGGGLSGVVWGEKGRTVKLDSVDRIESNRIDRNPKHIKTRATSHHAPLREDDGHVPGGGLERLVDAVLHEHLEEGREARVVVPAPELVAGHHPVMWV
jgi:hypothetical protein